jgi:hypothetical protein
MQIKHWHKDGKKQKRERLAPVKAKAASAATKQLVRRLKNG